MENFWPDVSEAFTARPSGYDILTGSIDVFVPSGDSSDGSVYGLLGFDYDPGFDDVFLDYGFLIVPNTRAIRLVIDGAVVAESTTEVLPYDTWFSVGIQANYLTGDIVVLLDGTIVPGLTTNFSYIVFSSLVDVDLFCENSISPPTSRTIFSDNYRVAVDLLVPTNDNFADALPLSGVSGQTIGFNVGASAEPGEPDHALLPATAFVWYAWMAPQSGLFTFDTIGSTLNTVLAVYAGDSLDLLTEVASNVDSPGTQRSRVVFTANAGTTYRIAVDGIAGAQDRLVLRWGPTPPNDDLLFAQVLTGQSGSATGTTDLATKELGEADHAGNRDGNSIWYSWVAPSTTGVLFDTIGSGIDTVLAVYTGSDVQSLTVEAANDDISFGNRRSRVLLNAVEGQEYWIAIEGFFGERGPTVLNWAPGGISNDDFPAAQVLTGQGGTVTGTTDVATREVGEPNHADAPGADRSGMCGSRPRLEGPCSTRLGAGLIRSWQSIPDQTCSR
jgi:hypothetical protein